MNPTNIPWTTWTSNPIRARNKATGRVGHFCVHVSEGCENCYAGKFNLVRYGTGLDFIAQNRDKVELYLYEKELQEWTKPRYRGGRVFVCDMTDLFYEGVPDAWIDKVFATMALAPELTFQVLTKRPERMREYVLKWVKMHGSSVERPYGQPLPNVWLGVTVENQRWAHERIPILLDTPAAVRFISAEPMLGPVDFSHLIDKSALVRREGRQSEIWLDCIDWIICGGESGAERRPFDLDWARDIREQCFDTGVAFFMKQGSAFKPDYYEKLPEDLHIRQWPDDGREKAPAAEPVAPAAVQSTLEGL